jgi:thioredoxin reductase (NADPH)
MPSDHEVAFPVLATQERTALVARGRSRKVHAGEVLFAEGDRDFCCFLVLEGAVEIVEHSRGRPHRVAVLRSGEFTGDVDTLSGRRALVTGRAMEAGQVLELDTASLRRAVEELPDVGETILKAFLMRRTLLLGQGFEGVRIIGSRYSPACHRLRDFASRNGVPFRWLDLETDEEADGLLRQFGVPAAATPIILTQDGTWVSNPTLADFARCAGLTRTVEADRVYDLIVVGAGPAGLAASVYAASEGLDVLTTDSLAAGGQAGTSSRIENYLGFPTGISGTELTRNALLQAQRFGARITVPRTVAALGVDGGDRVVTFADRTRLRTRCVLIATGAEYRKLDVPRFGDFENAGIYYAVTETEARLCQGEDVLVVGAGNSAGQATVQLASHARQVHLLLRGTDLGTSMSRYLVDRIQTIKNVTIHRGTVVTGFEGDGRLSAVHTRTASGKRQTFQTGSLFLFIGADPNSGWLRGCVELDRRGFVLTGNDLSREIPESDHWRSVGRTPFLLETSLPGVFAAGDVRSGSVKRVASAVGEGSMAVSFVHAHVVRG